LRKPAGLLIRCVLGQCIYGATPDEMGLIVLRYGVCMERDEEIGLVPARDADPLIERDVDVPVACHDDRVAAGFAKDRPETARHGEHDGLLEHASGCDGAGIEPTMTGVDDDDRPAAAGGGGRRRTLELTGAQRRKPAARCCSAG